MDFELDGKRARVTSKGGALNLERILWESGAARLLPRLIGRRRHGPVSSPTAIPRRRARPPSLRSAPTPAGPGEQWTLHRLRHSRLTHLGEDGWSAPMLMAPSGHENPRTLSLYVKSSAKAVARALASAGPQPPAALTMPIGSQRVTGGSVPDAPQRQPDT